jgi:predicted amidophosphoribosyltransferase
MQEHAEELRAQPEPRCPACGAPVTVGAAICPMCHHPLDTKAAAPKASLDPRAPDRPEEPAKEPARPTLAKRTL